MIIKRFKMDPGIKTADIANCAGARRENKVLTITKYFDTHLTTFVKLIFDNKKWNDIDGAILSCEDPCKSALFRLYKNNGEEIPNYPWLKCVVKQYNEYMKSLPFLEEIKNDLQ